MVYLCKENNKRRHNFDADVVSDSETCPTLWTVSDHKHTHIYMYIYNMAWMLCWPHEEKDRDKGGLT